MPLRAASLSTRRNTSSGYAATAVCADQYSPATPDNSSVTFGDDEADNESHRSEDDEPEARCWKEDADNEGSSDGMGGGAGGKLVRKPAERHQHRHPRRRLPVEEIWPEGHQGKPQPKVINQSINQSPH
uniref:Uncharacterized protein n=1 Tax=Oryza barthii TaxID=65489 RepID=A0A0D3FSX5_9ORYZ